MASVKKETRKVVQQKAYLRDIAGTWKEYFALAFCMIVVRIGGYFETCREEQIGCVEPWILRDTFEKLHIPIALLSIFMLNFSIQWNLSSSSSEATTETLVARALSWPTVLLVTLHWMFSKSAISLGQNQNFERVSRYIALIVYLLWTIFYALQLLIFQRPSKGIFQLTTLLIMMVLGSEFSLIFAITAIAFLLIRQFSTVTGMVINNIILSLADHLNIAFRTRFNFPLHIIPIRITFLLLLWSSDDLEFDSKFK